MIVRKVGQSYMGTGRGKPARRCHAEQKRSFSIAHMCIFYFCSWLALTDPRDVARIESKTVIITQEQRDAVPIPKTGLSQLGRWMSEEDFEKAFNARFPGCMKGE